MIEIEEFIIEGYEKVYRGTDTSTGFDAFITIYSQKLGMPYAHCRYTRYEDTKDQLDDSLRLAYGMALKASILNKDCGGASIIINSEGAKSKSECMKQLSQMINALDINIGVIPCAGTDHIDLVLLASYTNRVAIRDYPVTRFATYGVSRALQAVLDYKKAGSPSGMHATIYGLGKVGLDCAMWLGSNDVRLTVASRNTENLNILSKHYDFATVAPENALSAYCNLLVPCKTLPLLDKKTVSILNTDIICGPANAQLIKESANKFMNYIGVIYVPDYVANAGSLIASLSKNKTVDRVNREIDCIYDLTKHILHKSKKDRKTTTEVANDIALSRLLADDLDNVRQAC